MENDNNIPAIRSSDEIKAEELRQYWLDPSQDYPEPHFFYEFNGVGFSPLGGIQAISGQKKNGKTFMLAQLMAVALGNGTNRIFEYLPGLRARPETVEWLGHEPRVLYCDTEMEKLNTAKVLRRVHWLCDWDMKQANDRFFVLWLREVPKSEQQSSNKERWRLIKNAIEQKNPDIVFVDGLRDLVDDFNDNAESSEIVGDMMSLASQRNICIWNVLHYNPRPSNDDESKMRGHLGTELGNKVSDTFISTKKKDANTGAVTFTVKQQDARGKDVDDWTFEIVDDAGGLGIPKIIGGGSKLMGELKIIEDKQTHMIQETIRVLKSTIYPPKSEYITNILKALKDELHVGEEKAKKYFNLVQDTYPTMMYQLKDRRFTISKTEMKAIDEGLPFAAGEISEP
jgi:hypothetical protein